MNYWYAFKAAMQSRVAMPIYAATFLFVLAVFATIEMIIPGTLFVSIGLWINLALYWYMHLTDSNRKNMFEDVD